MKEAKQQRDKAREKQKEAEAKSGEKNPDDDLEKAMGGQGQAEEYRIEQIRTKAEAALLSDESLLGQHIESVSICIRSSNIRKFKTLYRQALLCWCKFMVVDRQFCEDNLKILWELLKREDVSSENKCNIVISLGDMCCRFPNELDPHLGHLYKLLTSKEEDVKKITLMVLTHLIFKRHDQN
eukprot:UN24901